MNSFRLRYPRVEWSRRSSDHHTQSSGSCLSCSIVVWWFRYTSSFFSSLSADADIGKIARGTRVRGVTVELAVQQVRELRLVDQRPVRFESSARVRAHIPCSRMMPPMRLLDAVTPLLSRAALIFLAPGRPRLSRRTARTSPAIGSTRSIPGRPVIPVTGERGRPASRIAPISGGVGPYHACLRVNTGAACPETSASISNRRSRMPWTQRRGVDRAMSYSALISRDGLPLSHDCTICHLNASS